MNKIMLRCTALILCILLITVPCFAVVVDVGDPEYFSSLEFPHIETANSHNVTGYIEAVDAREFLSWIVLYENLNLEFSDFTTTPYAIQDITFDLGGSYADCMVATMMIGRLNVAQGLNSGWVMLNGRPYDKSNGYIMWSADDGPAPWYVSVSGVDPPGSAGPYTYGLTSNQNHSVIVYQAGQNDPLIEIRDKLTTISVNMANMLSNNTDSIKNLLSNIYQSCDNIEYSLTDISNYLSSISLSCSTIASKANQIYAQDTATQDIIDGISDYLETELPVMEQDLYSISQTLTTFSYNFSNYASQVLNYLSSIDSTVEHIDGTLDEMMEHFNGTALEGVPVPGSGAPNLWQLIKGAVSNSLSGLANLFNLLFGAIGEWSYNASLGFDYLTSINSYNPIPYNPGDLFNILPQFSDRQVGDQGVVVNIVYPEVRVVSVGSGNTQFRTVFIGSNTQYPIVLEPGRYRLGGTGMSYVGMALYNSNQSFIKTVWNNPIDFNVDSTVYCKLELRCTASVAYSGSFVPTLIKVA